MCWYFLFYVCVNCVFVVINVVLVRLLLLFVIVWRWLLYFSLSVFRISYWLNWGYCCLGSRIVDRVRLYGCGCCWLCVWFSCWWLNVWWRNWWLVVWCLWLLVLVMRCRLGIVWCMRWWCWLLLVVCGYSGWLVSWFRKRIWCWRCRCWRLVWLVWLRVRMVGLLDGSLYSCMRWWRCLYLVLWCWRLVVGVYGLDGVFIVWCDCVIVLCCCVWSCVRLVVLVWRLLLVLDLVCWWLVWYDVSWCVWIGCLLLFVLLFC